MRLRSRTTPASRVRLISTGTTAQAHRSNGAPGVVSFRLLADDRALRSTLEAARSGDEQAISRLFRLLYPRVLRYLRVVRPSDAERLAAAAWSDTVLALRRFDGDEPALVALALTIAHRRASERPRRRFRRNRAVEPSSIEGLSDLRGLPRARAEVLLLRVLGGMTLDEVADVTGRGRASVRLLQYLALRALTIGAERREASR